MAEVVLHIYDVTNSGSDKTNSTILQINKIFKDEGEWSFGFCEQGSGVFSCPSVNNRLFDLQGWVNRFAHASDAAMETEIVTASKVAYRFLVGVTNNATASPESAGNSNRGAPRFQAAWFKNLITTGAKPSSSSDLETKEEDALRQHQQPDAEPQQQHNNGDVSLVKSQSLVKVLQLIHAQEHGSLFERWFPAQESDKYKSIVQQHVNRETIQTKLRKDAYSSCSRRCFYRVQIT
ncbi:unnamed protein product [Malus baccata var. baccata]